MGVVETGFHIATQGALQVLYESITNNYDLLIKHGNEMKLQGVWACLLRTGVCRDLLEALTDEMARLRPVIYR